MLRSGNMRDLTSCSSTGNSTPMGNASPAYQRRSTGAWTEIRSTAWINLTPAGSKLNLGLGLGENLWITTVTRSAERLGKGRDKGEDRARQWMSDCCNLFRRSISPPQMKSVSSCAVRKSEAQRANGSESEGRNNRTDNEVAGTGTGLAQSHWANHQPDRLSE